MFQKLFLAVVVAAAFVVSEGLVYAGTSGSKPSLTDEERASPVAPLVPSDEAAGETQEEIEEKQRRSYLDNEQLFKEEARVAMPRLPGLQVSRLRLIYKHGTPQDRLDFAPQWLQIARESRYEDVKLEAMLSLWGLGGKMRDEVRPLIIQTAEETADLPSSPFFKNKKAALECLVSSDNPQDREVALSIIDPLVARLRLHKNTEAVLLTLSEFEQLREKIPEVASGSKAPH